MIVTTQEEWVQLYGAIREDSRRSDEKHVFIYASSKEADSVAALRILEKLFIKDGIPHGWMPVSRYTEIEADFKKHYKEGESALRTVVLINCGAAEDLRSLLELYDRQNVRIVIIDSHRPICHMHNFDSPTDNIIVLLDEESEAVSKAEIPPAEEEEDLDGSESEEEDAPPAQRRRIDSPSSSGRGQEGDVEGQQQQQGGSARARQQERRRRREERERYYSTGVSYGKPVACMLYDLAYALQQENSFMLWLALVGLTDQLVHDRISMEKYEQYYLQYHSHVTSAGHLDIAAEREAADGDGTLVLNTAIMCRILPQDDYRFGLLWHWNLYEAMQYSPYIAARLHTYTEKGRVMLEMLLAKLGIPLQQAQSSYLQDMQPRYRNSLGDRLTSHAAAFKLGELCVRSFQLQDGLKRCVNAVDLVHAVTALLECGTKKGPIGTIDDHVDKFWRAYNALTWGDDGGELQRGLELAKRVQRALVMDGGSVLLQKQYHNFKHFRVFDLSDHKMTNQHLVSHPMALQRLAAFFQEQHFQASGRRKPVVLIGPKSTEGRCLVIGFEATSRMQGNRLGMAFAAAAEDVRAQAWQDLFDTTVMEVAVGDVDRFKSELLRQASELIGPSGGLAAGGGAA